MPAVIPANLILLMMLTQLAGFVVAIAKGREANSNVGWVAGCITFLSLALSVVIFLTATPSNFPYTAGIEWFNFGGEPFLLGIYLDELGVLMLLLVNFIALLVQGYSLAYLQKDPDLYRYFGFLSLFIFSMLGLVTARSLLIFYVFWELVGLSSYLLIGFWHTKPEVAKAAKKAFVVNRIGDAALMLGIFWVYHELGTTDFIAFANGSISNFQFPTWAGLLLFGGCVAKSAQFPLYIWLPDAMEGPTPVSALIHAATMVAAGIFLLARVFPLLSPEAHTVIAITGAVTAILGGLNAVSQFDIKKVLAYSTISQLGLMVMGMGVGAREAALFHLFTHAFFKAGLFLSAGAVIHALHRIHRPFDAQDMRLMGGLRQQLPVTFWCYLLCAASLAGLPFFSGFLSKDAILAESWQWAGNQDNVLAYLIPLSGFVTACLTAFYMTRQVWLVFFDEFRNPIADVEQVKETSIYLQIPIVLLAAGSVGFAFSWNPFSAEHSWFFAQIPGHLVENHWVGLLTTLLVGVGIYYGHKLFSEDAFLQLKWGFDADKIANRVVEKTLQTAQISSIIDHKLIDGFVNTVAQLQVGIATFAAWFDHQFVDGVVNGVARLAASIGKLTRSIQTGKVQLYIVVAMLGLLILIVLASV